MKSVKIRDVTIGDGIPKICVPIVGETMAKVEQQIQNICSLPSRPDLVELRADWFTEIFNKKQRTELLRYVRSTMGETPVLFTVRTAKEGGRQSITLEQYEELLLDAAASGYVDAVDVEAFSFDVPLGRLVEQLHQKQVLVIASNHDFHKTPAREELLERVERMWQMDADIAKLAVMPADMEDVLELLHTTWQAQKAGRGPIITMSMSGRGIVSRFTGELFGSAVTFASAGRASAPGQMDAEKLRQMLKMVHESTQEGAD